MLQLSCSKMGKKEFVLAWPKPGVPSAPGKVCETEKVGVAESLHCKSLSEHAPSVKKVAAISLVDRPFVARVIRVRVRSSNR